MKRRGMAQIIAVVLTISIVVAAIGILWAVVRPSVDRNDEILALEGVLVDLEVKNAYIDDSNQTAYVAIERGKGKGNLSALDFIFSEADGTNYIYRYPIVAEIPDEFGTVVFNITALGVRNQDSRFVDFSNIVSVGVAFVARISSGKEVTSSVKDTYGGGSESLRSSSGLGGGGSATVYEGSNPSASCELTNAYWQPSGLVANGTSVQLLVQGTDCDASDSISFEIYEDDLLFDDLVTSLNGSYSSTTWVALWTYPGDDDIGSDSRDYYFKATLISDSDVSVNSKSLGNPLLNVNQSSGGSGTPASAGEGFFFDDYSDLSYVNQGSIVNLQWDNASEIYLGGASGEGFESGLIGLWHLNELSGDAFDASGFGNDGTVSGATQGVIGKFGNAYGFGGTGDYVDLGSSGLVEGVAAFSVCAWAMTPETAGGYDNIVSQWSDPYNFRLVWDSGEDLFFLVRNATSVDRAAKTTGNVFMDSDWHHVCGVYNGTTVFVTYDGVIGGTTAKHSGLTFSPNGDPLVIGVQYGGYYPWNGSIDEVAIWDRGLTQSEITTLYNTNPLADYDGSNKGSFESSLIDTGGLFNKINLTMTGTNLASVEVEISTDGSTWCSISNGGELDDSSACLPGEDFYYRVNFNGGANLDSVDFKWGFVPECSAGDTQSCDNQNGVCSGSYETCVEPGLWPGCDSSTYSGWASSQGWTYESSESLCSDGQDNDCSKFTDDLDWKCFAAVEWEPPIGIPAPSFGINESHYMYKLAPGENCTNTPEKCYDFGSGLEPYRDAGNGPYTHYVDNTVLCNDNNAGGYGNHTHPRCTLILEMDGNPNDQSLWFKEGSVVEIHGGPYDYPDTQQTSFYSNAISSRPSFFRGAGTNMPVFGEFVLEPAGQYTIIENIYFNNTFVYLWSASTIPIISPHYYSVRNNIFKGDGTLRGINFGLNAISVYGQPIDISSNIVIYNNEISYYGDYNTSTENDAHGVGVWGSSEYVWIIDNHIHHNGGDSTQIGNSANRATNHIYIGRNDMHDDRENAVDIKQATDVIVSQNKMYNYLPLYAGISGAHQGNMLNDDCPKNIWLLYNEMFNTVRAFSSHSGDGIYLVGNLIYNISGTAITPFQFYGGGENLYFVGNTVVSSAEGLHFQDNYPSASPFSILIADNIFETTGSTNIWLENQPTYATLDNNLFYRRGGQAMIKWHYTPYNLTEIQNQYGQCLNCIDEDPQFIDPLNSNFSLSSNSSAIDNGALSSVYDTFYNLYGINIKRDREGRIRPQGSEWDIGAYEY